MVIRNTISVNLLFLSLLIAQDSLEQQPVERIHTEGAITYVSGEMYYTDIGKNNGVDIGDSLEVKRKTETIGLIRITNLSRKSSIGSAVWAKIEFLIGDRVVLDKTITKVMEEPISPPVAVEEAQPPIEEQKVQETTVLKKPRRREKINQRGKIALRGTFFGSQSLGEAFISENRTIGIVSYSLNLYNPYPLTFSLYGRSSTNPSKNQITYSLYHAMIEISSPKENVSGQIGRIYTSNLSGIGVVDGVLTQLKINPIFSTGVVAGTKPDLQSNKISRKNISMGAYLYWSLGQSFLTMSGNIAGIGQYRSSNIDREFLYIQNRVRFGRLGSFFLSGELDLDRRNLSGTRNLIELSSVNGSVRLKPTRWLSLSSRYSARKNVKYFQSHASVPDSLFDNQIRTGWFNSVYFNFFRHYSVQIGHSYRSQEAARKASQMISLTTTVRNLTAHRLTFRGGFSFLDNEQVNAYRARFSSSVSLRRFVNIWAEYELYQHRFGGVGDPNRRNTLSSDITFNLQRRIYFTLLVERSWEKELIYYNAFGEVSYRF